MRGTVFCMNYTIMFTVYCLMVIYLGLLTLGCTIVVSVVGLKMRGQWFIFLQG